MRARTRSFVIAGVAASVVGAVTFGILRDPVAAAPPPPDLPGSENTSLVSAGVGGSAPNGPSWGAAMSSNARFVTFLSVATNLVDDDGNGLADPDTNGHADVFLLDRATHKIRRINTTASGAETAGLDSTGYGDGDAGALGDVIVDPLTGSDAIVALAVPGDLGATEGPVDPAKKNVYLKYTSTGEVHLLSVGVGGAAPDGDSVGPTLTGNVFYDNTGTPFAQFSVGFDSQATNIDVQNTGGSPAGGCYVNYVVRGLPGQGLPQRIDVNNNGITAPPWTGQCHVADTTPNGVVFNSTAADGTAPNPGGGWKAYRRDPSTFPQPLVPLVTGTTGNDEAVGSAGS